MYQLWKRILQRRDSINCDFCDFCYYSDFFKSINCDYCSWAVEWQWRHDNNRNSLSTRCWRSLEDSVGRLASLAYTLPPHGLLRSPPPHGIEKKWKYISENKILLKKKSKPKIFEEKNVKNSQFFDLLKKVAIRGCPQGITWWGEIGKICEFYSPFPREKYRFFPGEMGKN